MTPNLIDTELDPNLIDAESELDPDFDDPDFDDPDRAPITELDTSHLDIEDDAPVDNFQSEVQQRLLVEPLYSSQALPSPFLAAANVGVFYKLHGEPIVPDVFLSLGVQRSADYTQRQNRTYFVWEFGKVPEVCIEIVSNRQGDELTLSRRSQRKGKTVAKKDIYAQIKVDYYVVFDPLQQLPGETDMNGALLRVWGIGAGGYSELTPPQGLRDVGQFVWLDGVGIGLTLWEGGYEEDLSRLWLRWCDREGQVIPTGAERAEQERQRAEAERQRAERAEQRAARSAELLRQQGIDPDTLV